MRTRTVRECCEVLRNGQCACGRGKMHSFAYCAGCYGRLPGDIKAALWLRIGGGFEAAYTRAEEWFAENGR
ncbi:MAG: hypothetical protein ABIJ95_11915 [Pseudomonadota bacterium]